MAAFGAIAAGIGAVGGIAQAISGAKQRRDARRALENYQRQELRNVAEGLQVYTKGVEMQRDEVARLGSSAIDAFSRGGSRALVSGLGRLQYNQQLQQRQAMADLERQQAEIDQMRVRDAMTIRGMQEQREMADIAALSSQYEAGNQMMWSGIGSIAQSGMSGMQMLQDQDLSEKALK